jgi:hypothetical protein
MTTGGRRVIVKNWRTGAEHAVADFSEHVTPAALKPDGTTVVTAAMTGSVFVWTPGSAARRLATRGGARARFAGAGVVFGDTRGPRLNGRRLGAPTVSAGDLAADERHVLWTANGCLIVADVTDTGPPGPGPCPRSEIAETNRSQPLARTLKVHLRCVYAPSRCRGTVRLMGMTQRFAIAAGRAGTVRVRLSAAAYRRLQRQLAREPDDPRDTTINVSYRARTDDGAEIPGYVPGVSIDRPE